jgi:competence ComEA-like helix-hairpin-helix protein
MKHVSHLALLTAATAAMLTVMLRATPDVVTAQEQRSTSLAPSPETALYVRLCADCHDLERVESRRRTKSEWSTTLEQMIDDGAEMSDEEFERIVDLLVRNFGAVWINRAAADELVKILAISSKDADAIVSYRTAKGNFADFEALRKVPDIDMAPLEQRKNSIRF